MESSYISRAIKESRVADGKKRMSMPPPMLFLRSRFRPTAGKVPAT
jgi:hypothetical protein